MHAHPRQPLQHDGALALQVARDDRLGDRPEACGLGLDDIGQQRVAQGDEDHGIAIGHALQAFQQQTRRRGVDEFGEQHDQRPAFQAGIELGEPQRKIRFLGPVAELARRVLKPGKGAPAGRGLEILPDAGIEAERADMVAAAQRHPAQQQAGMDRMVEPRQAVDRLGHQVAGIEGEHDLVVALDPEFLRQQLEMLGRVLPVDEAVVEPLDMVAQRLELGALAPLALDLDAVHRIAAEELHGGRGDAPDIGHDVDRKRQRPPLAPAGEAERATPAQPKRLDGDPPAPEWPDRQCDRANGSRQDIEPGGLGRRDIAALLWQELDRHCPRGALDGGADAQLPLAADV